MAEEIDQILDKMTGNVGTVNTVSSSESDKNEQQFYCDAKSQNMLNDFIDREKPKLVALVGFAGYGKSTFIGTLYHTLVMNLKYKGYAFVDSDTYAGFERRVFLRRANDENISDTKRNILGENDLLNLKLQSDNGIIHQIVISDKAGETYSNYESSSDKIDRDLVLENADLVLIFVDAEADSKRLASHNLIMEKYKGLISRLKSAGKISSETEYAVVFTKADLVNDESRKAKLKERETIICTQLNEIICSKAIGVFEVNSKDLDNELLNELFSIIISPKETRNNLKELDWVKTEIEVNK